MYSATPTQEVWKKVKNKIQKILEDIAKTPEIKGIFLDDFTNRHPRMFLPHYPNHLK